MLDCGFELPDEATSSDGTPMSPMDANLDGMLVAQACEALLYCCEKINPIPELAQTCTITAKAGNERDCSAVFEAPWETAHQCYQDFLMN